ncbi:hypothetical protein C7A10_29825 [Pseudomonas fluorescens]|uniref:Uncharacterized protein n=1 Tax=Pseudomonas fluorescens TaxID=294 RepID=A0A2T0HLS3_PSEFL|nr:hypothetical protein C7A10_29825 [Pseudomonas fluorescens]
MVSLLNSKTHRGKNAGHRPWIHIGLNVSADPCGSWLACDTGNSVYQRHRGDAIAGKPAPTCVQVRPIKCVAIRLASTSSQHAQNDPGLR